MAYELTSAAATTGNPYAIVGAAIIDTIRASARQSATTKGYGLSQNQLSAENFSGYINDAIGQSGLKANGAEDVFSRQLIKSGAGVYSQITAPTYTRNNDSQTTKRSIICTTLTELGEIHPAVYYAGMAHWHRKSDTMISGYHSWGYWVAAQCRKNWLMRKICAKIARARYHYILFEKWNFIGWATIVIGEPICYLIGLCTSRGNQNAIN